MFFKSNLDQLKEKGIVMVSAIIFILTMMIIGLCFMLMLQAEVKEETVSEKFKTALYNAEAGLSRTQWLLTHDAEWRQNSLDNGTSTIDLVGTITNGASYTVYLSRTQGGTGSLNPNPDAGSVTWRYSLPRDDDIHDPDHPWYKDNPPCNSYPYDIQYLDNGRILITEMWGYRRVFELMPDFTKYNTGNILWAYYNKDKMTGAKKMANGDILITEPHRGSAGDKGGVYIIDAKDGSVKWKWNYQGEGNSWMQDADELPDGNILITMRYGKPYSVVVVDKDTQKVIWSYDAKTPTDADYLPPKGPNEPATILITEKNIPGTKSGRVIEVTYDDSKEIVWKTQLYLNNPYDAERLPNGHTVICESGGYDYEDRSNEGRISEVDADGKETIGSPLVKGLSAPHAIDIVPQANGNLDILVANTDSRGGRGNEILRVRGWSRMGNRVKIASIGDYLSCKNTVIVEANLDPTTGILTNMTWKEVKGVPVEYRQR